MQIFAFAKRVGLREIARGFPESLRLAHGKLHKSFLCRFRVDAAVFQAQAFDAERKDCTAAAASKAPNARSRGANAVFEEWDRSGGDRSSWRGNGAREASLNP